MNELNIPMHPYQEQAKDFIKTHPYCGLFLEMGLGKTLITLVALYEINPPGHVLVIAPKNIARATWLEEIKKWRIPIRTKSFIVNEKGKDLSRAKRLELYAQMPNDPPTVYFINRELVPDLVKNMPVRGGRPVWYFPTVVVDELQSFKSSKAARFKALKRVRGCVTRFIGLTGTPAPNGLLDLWAQMYLIDMGASLGNTVTKYRERYFRPTLYMNGYPVQFELQNKGCELEIHQAIADSVISMKNTMLQLPPVTYNNVYAYMDDKEAALYNTMKKDQVLALVDGTEIAAVNAAVLQAKLSQMASGALYTDGNKEYQLIHERKLEQCQYIVENTGSPVIIAYHFKSDLDMLSRRFPDGKAFDGSPEMQTEWNEGHIPVMFLQPASSGFGVNIQYGGHTLIWYTVPWNLEAYLQTNARVYRQGQTHPVVIHHILTWNTVDDRVLRAIDKKETTQQALLDAVKAELFGPQQA